MTLAQLHQAYVRLSGRAMTFSLCERRWHEWQKAGFVESDLQLVIEWIARENKNNDWQYSLRFSRLIGDLEHFDELLAECKAQNRNRRAAPTEKARVSERYQPTVGEAAPDNVIKIKDAIIKAAANL